jgi:hypothetical protein
VHHSSTKIITDVIVYWAFFWNAIYLLAPPRETFNSPKYNKFLDLVSYYGALNVRSLLMRLYGAPPSGAPPVPKLPDPPSPPPPDPPDPPMPRAA